MNKIFFCIVLMLLWQVEAFSLPIRNKVLAEADRLLNQANISYVYGGSRVGAAVYCDACTQCLDRHKPEAKERLHRCPVCTKCSLDCSHFISLVYKGAGLKAPYLTTKQMVRKSAFELEKDFFWVDLGRKPRRILPGDILVYPGHVVMVEEVTRQGIGKVIHSTSGKEVQGPGQGIQRQSLVKFDSYKGPLLRILRHKLLLQELNKVKASQSKLRTSL